MKKLTGSAVRAVKIVHLIGAMLWTGGIACILAALLTSVQQASPEAVLAQIALVETFDYFVIIPSVALCIAVGFMYGFRTGWGFAAHTWVLLKWVLFLVACVPAALFFLPLLEGMREFVVHYGLEALTMDGFNANLLILVAMVAVQLILSIVMIGISAYKPFKGKRRTGKRISERPQSERGSISRSPAGFNEAMEFSFDGDVLQK